MINLILVDTNVLLRVVEHDHEHHVAAVASTTLLLERGCELCVVPQVHYEFWVVATRPLAKNGLGMSATEAEHELARLDQSFFRFLRDERLVYTYWRSLVQKYAIQGKAAHDARLVAAMQKHGVSQLLTFNGADFRRYFEIEVLDPEAVISK
ncbi:MAG: PIN domain-containing protein [Bythopirellula sp.]|nr:PIN domain-containing protein [Bythopirellula sp.]